MRREYGRKEGCPSRWSILEPKMPVGDCISGPRGVVFTIRSRRQTSKGSRKVKKTKTQPVQGKEGGGNGLAQYSQQAGKSESGTFLGSRLKRGNRLNAGNSGNPTAGMGIIPKTEKKKGGQGPHEKQ